MVILNWNGNKWDSREHAVSRLGYGFSTVLLKWKFFFCATKSFTSNIEMQWNIHGPLLWLNEDVVIRIKKFLRTVKNCFKCFYFISYFLFFVENNCEIVFKSRIEFRVLQVDHVTNKLSYSSPLKARLGKHFLDENVKSVSIAFPPLPPQWRVKQSDRPTWSFEPDKNVIPENAARWRQANLFRNELPLIGRVGEVEGRL